jgi:hypothetical protein
LIPLIVVVPTVHFERLFAFVIIGHGRRQLLWFAVTRHPTGIGATSFAGSIFCPFWRARTSA